MNRWRLAFWSIIALSALAVTITLILQVRSGSWAIADQVGGTISLHLAWIVPSMTLLIEAVWRRAFPRVTGTAQLMPSAGSTPMAQSATLAERTAAARRRLATAIVRAARNKTVLSGVAAVGAILAASLSAFTLVPKIDEPAPYKGVAYMSGDETLHFGPRTAEVTSESEKQHILDDIRNPDVREARRRSLTSDIAVIGRAQTGNEIQLWFLEPAAVVNPSQLGEPDHCERALEKATKQLSGAYVVVQLNSDAVVCITPRQPGTAEVTVHSGPVEFRVAYAFVSSA